jgi:hypothetical protein
MTNMFVENSKVWKYSTMGVTVVRSTTSTQLTMAPTQEGVLRQEKQTDGRREGGRRKDQMEVLCACNACSAIRCAALRSDALR